MNIRLYDPFHRPLDLAVRQRGLEMSEDQYEIAIRMPMPDVREDDIDISLTGDVLTISAERKHRHENRWRGGYMRQASYGRVSRSVRLPAEVDLDGSNAALHDGLLTIRLPKTGNNSPKISVSKVIPVKSLVSPVKKLTNHVRGWFKRS